MSCVAHGHMETLMVNIIIIIIIILQEYTNMFMIQPLTSN